MAYLAFKSDILTKAGQQARKDDKKPLVKRDRNNIMAIIVTN